MAAQTAKVQGGYCELAGSEGKSRVTQLCHLILKIKSRLVVFG